METTLEWREQLTATTKTCRTSQEALVEKLREARQNLAKKLRRMGLEQNNGARSQAHTKLRNLYYSNWLSAKYPIVDLSFADAKMNLLIERTQDGARIIGLADRDAIDPLERIATVSRFAKQESSARRDLCDAFPESRHTLGNFFFDTFQLNRVKYRSYSGRVCCNRPEGSPRSLLRKFRDIGAIGLEARAAAIRAGVTIDGADFGRLFLWQPRIEDLYITENIPVRDDPAVLVTCGERAHLVAFWDSPDENPIEGVIREFSEGSFDEVDR